MLLKELHRMFDKRVIFKYNYTYRGKRREKNWRVILPVVLFLLGVFAYVLSRFLLPSQWVSKYVVPISRIVSLPLKGLFGIVPFAFLEVFLVCAIPLIVILGYISYRLGDNSVALKNILSTLLCTLGAMLLTFSLTLHPGYYTVTLEESLGLDQEKVTLSGLKNATYYVAEQAAKTRNEAYVAGEPSTKLRSYSPKLKSSYRALSQSMDVFRGIPSRPKGAMLSVPLSHLGIGGMFSPFTCEAIINMDTTPPALPFSAAHEMAHSLCIARENEANFSAYLACIYSGDAYSAYSGYFNALLYLMNALYTADVNEYRTFLAEVDPLIMEDINAYFAHNQQYEGKASEVHGKINDAYLKSNGQEAGTQSYGMVVELFIKWHQREGHFSAVLQ